MIYKIAHTFQPEIFVPWCSVGRHEDFTRLQADQPITMSDGVKAGLISIREIHILSDEAHYISMRLYNMPSVALLIEWYKRNACITDLFFCHITLKQYVKSEEPDPDAPPIPE